MKLRATTKQLRAFSVAPYWLASVLLILGPSSSIAQEQDAESKALDSTATQWSAQIAYQQTTYKTDIGFAAAIVNTKGPWFYYGEYQTSLIYDKGWPGSAVDNSFRINMTYTWQL